MESAAPISSLLYPLNSVKALMIQNSLLRHVGYTSYHRLSFYCCADLICAECSQLSMTIVIKIRFHSGLDSSSSLVIFSRICVVRDGTRYGREKVSQQVAWKNVLNKTKAMVQ